MPTPNRQRRGGRTEVGRGMGSLDPLITILVSQVELGVVVEALADSQSAVDIAQEVDHVGPASGGTCCRRRCNRFVGRRRPPARFVRRPSLGYV